MKILYELVITEETGFTASDFPDRFEILRGKGKTPLVFKPVAINLQEIYSRLVEAEALLKMILDDTLCPSKDNLYPTIESNINEYFDRHEQ